ncbi:MAG: hypothetical protein ACP5SH_12725 [Syntrophobacteraceae bacterium]
MATGIGGITSNNALSALHGIEAQAKKGSSTGAASTAANAIMTEDKVSISAEAQQMAGSLSQASTTQPQPENAQTQSVKQADTARLAQQLSQNLNALKRLSN